MVKKITTVNVEHELLEKAKEKGLNVSDFLQRKLGEQLGKKQVEIEEDVKECAKCGREMRKATSKNMDGLMWLYLNQDYGHWICPNCLSRELNKIPVRMFGGTARRK